LQLPTRPAASTVALVALIALALGAAPASAQSGRARLQGVVVDQQTYQPVEDATVALAGTSQEVVTDRWGSFAFPDAPIGAVEIHASAPGRPSVVQEVQVTRTGIVFAQIVLPSVAAVLSELIVQSSSPHASLAEASARTAADLLALQVPRTRAATGSVGDNDILLQLRGTTSLNGSTEPLILVDGVALVRDAAYDALLSIPASDVANIEVLTGAAAAARYPYAANGVIHIHTKRGN